MKTADYPNLLVRKRLTQPLDQSCKMLRELQPLLKADLAPPLLHGAFAVGVAYLEVGLADSLRYFLTQFPQKMGKEEFRFSKDEFMANYSRLIKAASDRYVMGLSYKSFSEFLATFGDILSLEWGAENHGLEADVQEIEATRNLLLHNNLVVNDPYLEQAGEKKRADAKDRSLPCDCTYVQASIAKMLALCERLVEAANHKYHNYTVIAANRRLWAFLFSSPCMPYDEFWKVDEDNDRIVAYKMGHCEKQLASSEILLLGLWRAHFSGNSDYLSRFNMKGLDQKRKEHLMFFLTIASDFSFY